MKNKLFILIVVVSCFSLSLNLTAGYESTTTEESFANSAHADEAYLTSMQEERARIESVDDAFLTENQEEVERMNADNDARTTWAEEQIERS